MPTIDFRKTPSGVPLGWQQAVRTSNTTSQSDLTINPPDSSCGLLITGIYSLITCTTTGTTVTLLFDGVAQFAWTSAAGVLNLNLQGKGLFVTSTNQTVVLRLSADATRTASNLVIVAATVKL